MKEHLKTHRGGFDFGFTPITVLPDSGNRYLSKVYDDDWMREAGFLEHKGLGTVGDLLRSQDGGQRNVIMARESDRVSSVIESMRANGISQVPLRDEGGWIKGVITEGAVLKALYEDRSRPTDAVEAVMDVIVDPKIDEREAVDPRDTQHG